MLNLILSRLGQGIIVLLLVSFLTFALLSAAGGDALTSLAEDSRMSREAIENLRRVYGLDKPITQRYLSWLSEAVQGRLGESLSLRAPVTVLLWPRFCNTLWLSGAGLVLAWLVSLILGILTARRPGSRLDRLCDLIILLSSSTPRIVVALCLLALAARYSLFTVGGNAASQVFWPAAALALPLVALFLAQTRESIKAAWREDFIRTARAKGLTESRVLLRHVLRGALNPLIIIFGYSLGGVMSGSVIVETILAWPGLGSLTVDAVRSRDTPLLLGTVLVAATAVLAGNLLADILLRLNDPRLRDRADNSGKNLSIATNL